MNSKNPFLVKANLLFCALTSAGLKVRMQIRAFILVSGLLTLDSQIIVNHKQTNLFTVRHRNGMHGESPEGHRSFDYHSYPHHIWLNLIGSLVPLRCIRTVLKTVI